MGTGLSHATGVSFAGAADLRHDVFDLGDRAVRRKFIGDRPARSFARESQFLLESGAIDFDYDAVDLIGKRFALRLPSSE